MNQLEKAITLDTEDWVLELPEPAPPFNFSRNYLNFRTKLFDKMRGEKYHRLTKRATIAIIIAAILFFISVVALAATVGKTFFLRHYSDHAILEVENTQEASYIYDFNVGYVPAGFTKTDEDTSKMGYTYSYVNGDRWFDISKYRLSAGMNIDEEDSPLEEFEIDNIHYIYGPSANPQKSNILVWNDGKYLYDINGILSKEELIKIAQHAR